jgi:hypothetical protein
MLEACDQGRFRDEVTTLDLHQRLLFGTRLGQTYAIRIDWLQLCARRGRSPIEVGS